MSYTTLDLANALKIKEANSKRIYEMLCQFKDTGVFKISVQELKERLGLRNLETKKDIYPSLGSLQQVCKKVRFRNSRHTKPAFNW
jgi:hypothetical protein